MNEREANEESMEASSVVPEGVRELLEQRSTYRTWLERLDDVGGEYRAAVAERVRSDYEDRLAGVARDLEDHRQELVSSAERRRGRLDELSKAFDARSAELEEAELRFQVGEFDDGTWEEKQAELTGGLEEIESELADARSAVEELEQILEELDEGLPAGSRGEPSASAAPPAAAPEARPPLKAMDGGLADGRAETEETPAGESSEAVAKSADDGDGAAREEPVAAAARSPETASAESASAESASDGTTDIDAEAEEYRDELEFLESLSLDDPDSFDAVSRMLEDEEDR